MVAAALADLELLAGATADELQALDARLEPRHYAPGEDLLVEGDPGRHFVILLDGTVTVTRAETRDDPLRVATGGRGSIFGELSTITGEPRRATVTASTPVSALHGEVDAFDVLVAIPGVLDRMVDLATQRLAEIARPVPAQLRDGTDVLIRPLLARDRERFSSALAHQSDEWRHRRFFSAVKPNAGLVEYLVHLDYLDHFAWVVGQSEPLTGFGTARFIRSHDDETVAEIAFEVDDQWHNRGVATLLLGALGAAASRLRVETFRAEVLYENRPMRAVMNKAGARWHHAESGVMETSFAVEGTRSLVPPAVWDALGEVADTVVEIASLALWKATAPAGGPDPADR
ncbi:MAG: GNAT family N-acetyltransferase [Acidimicrobiia bacterium]